MCSCGNPIFRPRPHECGHFWNRLLPSVASKSGHETKRHVLIGCQTCQTSRVLLPNSWSLTVVKANCRAKGKLFVCFWPALSALFRSSQLSGVFLAQKQHTCLPKVFLTSKNSCKEYFVERKQIKSTTAAVWRRKMSCLHPVRTRFFFRCTRLDATDGNGPC